MLRTTVLLRVALVTFLVGLGLVCAYGYALGRDAVVSAPVLAPYRTPLYIAGLVGVLPVLAGVVVTFHLLAVVDRGDASSTTAVVRLLRRLRVLLGVTAGYLLVCVVGMSTVLARLDLGTPGVVLAAFLAEVVLLSLVAVVTGRIRWLV